MSLAIDDHRSTPELAKSKTSAARDTVFQFVAPKGTSFLTFRADFADRVLRPARTALGAIRATVRNADLRPKNESRNRPAQSNGWACAGVPERAAAAIPVAMNSRLCTNTLPQKIDNKFFIDIGTTGGDINKQCQKFPFRPIAASAFWTLSQGGFTTLTAPCSRQVPLAGYSLPR